MTCSTCCNFGGVLNGTGGILEEVFSISGVMLLEDAEPDDEDCLRKDGVDTGVVESSEHDALLHNDEIGVV